MGDWEDAMQRLREEGLDDVVASLSQFEKNQLRDKAAKFEVAEKRAAELEDRVHFLEAGPKREAAMKKANIDVTKLRPAELELINGQRPAEGKEYDEEWAKGLVEKYQLPVSGAADEGTEEPPPWNPPSAGQGAVAGKTAIDPRTIAKAKAVDRMAFIEWAEKNHPGLYDQLLQGQIVTGIAYPGPLRARQGEER